MVIDQRVLADHHDRLIEIILVFHKTIISIVILSFIGYGLAAYAWYLGYLVSALCIATLSYLLFRRYGPLSHYLTKSRLYGRDGFPETFKMLDGEFAERQHGDVLNEIKHKLLASPNTKHQ